MSDKTSSSRKKCEDEFSEFLMRKISLAGGSLQIQHITGHLSQVRYAVRQAIGTSMTDIMQFLKKNKHLFSVDKHTVSLAKSSTISNLEYDSDSSNRSYSNLPSEIENGKGVIVKLFPEFGFIKSKDPIKTEIYFKSFCFGKEAIDLTSSLYIGAIVFFHAKKYKDDPNHNKSKCKYRATKVWRIDSDFESSTTIHKSRKTRDTGLYDPLHLDSEGIIQNVFPNLGFISVKGDNNNTVFFHKNRVKNYDNIVDLTKVFSKGDRVEFNAHRSSKADAKARWEATKVWKMGKELNMSESDSNQNINLTSTVNQPSVAHIKSKEMKKNQRGKICPRAHGAVIKFNEHELADGDSAVYYVCGTQVTEIGWEFSEGDDVYFDAVKIKSAPGWKAILVWTGQKPDIILPTCLGDFSEFTTDEEDNGEICNSIYTSKSSSYMSESCSSSVKTESVSSKMEDSKENTQKVSGFIVNKETEDSTKKQYKNNSTSEGSLTSDSSKKTHHLKRSKQLIDDTSSSKSVKRGSSETLSNWGDSPYPAGRTHKNIGITENFETHMTVKTANSMFTDDETESTSEYASALEDKTVKKKKGKNFACKNPNRGNIKRFHSVNGKIISLYSKFAEVKSKDIQHPVSFYLNDFYVNGMSVEELEVDDLKDILNVGDSISYNYFKIVDNLGQTWQKVTMAWLGSKPKNHQEMSAQDFIQEHDLYVTQSNEPDLAIKSTNNIFKVTENDTESTSEYASAVEEEKAVEWKKDENFPCKNPEFKESIKHFHNVNGKIVNVYSKFAEVKSCNLENTVSFFLNDFYLDGVCAEDQEVDDLKEILKVGDSISYNFFIIIDDLGQSFQKVTMAWRGSKPNEHQEMSAEDFIQEHNLSVTVNNQLKNEEISENKAAHRKFLTSFVDEVPDSHIEKLSRTESCSDEESLNFKLESPKPDRTDFPVDFRSLSSAVSKILKRDVFSLDSVVDFNSVSVEIINLILNSASAENVSSSNDRCLNCMQDSASLNCKTVNTKNTEVQTIITGDIIAQNICTDC